MGRTCKGCAQYCSCSSFSRNQWLKGDGYSRCYQCVRDDIYAPAYQCKECYRTFNNQNELNMHMQVHRPRQFKCPVCGDIRFKSPANAVQHVESGYCRGCKGKDNARQQIYDFAKKRAGGTPLLTNGSSNYRGGPVPDYPYQCPHCSRLFRDLGQMMQHMDQKHDQRRLLGM